RRSIFENNQRVYAKLEMMPVDEKQCDKFELVVRKVLICAKRDHHEAGISDCDDPNTIQAVIYDIDSSSPNEWLPAITEVPGQEYCLTKLVFSWKALIVDSAFADRELLMEVYWVWHRTVSTGGSVAWSSKLLHAKNKQAMSKFINTV